MDHSVRVVFIIDTKTYDTWRMGHRTCRGSNSWFSLNGCYCHKRISGSLSKNGETPNIFSTCVSRMSITLSMSSGDIRGRSCYGSSLEHNGQAGVHTPTRFLTLHPILSDLSSPEAHFFCEKSIPIQKSLIICKLPKLVSVPVPVILVDIHFLGGF